jgi:hypothetical protein
VLIYLALISLVITGFERIFAAASLGKQEKQEGSLEAENSLGKD